MKNLLLFISLLTSISLAIGQQTTIELPPTYLKGLQDITFSSANVNDICEAEGILAFATQIGIELYLGNRVIGSYSYQLLTANPHNNRGEIVCIVADTSNHRVLVLDKKGIGQINYNQGAAFNRKQFDTPIDFTQGIPAIQQKLNAYSVDQKVQSLLLQKLRQQTGILSIGINQKVIFQGNHLYVDGVLLYSLPSKIWEVEIEQFASKDSLLKLLILTNRDGLYRLTVNKNSASILSCQQLKIELPSGISIQNLRSMAYLEKWDALAIGTLGNGAFLYAYPRNELFTPIYQPQKGDNDKGHHYWSFCKIDAEHILAGNDIGEVEIINTKQQRSIARFEIEKGTQIRALAINQTAKATKTTSFWVGTRLNDTGKVYSLKVELGAKSPFSKSEILSGLSAIRTIFSSKKKEAFLVGTSKGLYTVKSDGLSELLDANPVSFICEDSLTNRIYFGEGQHLAYLKEGQLEQQKIALPDSIGELSYVINYGTNQVLLCTRDNFFSIGKWAASDSIQIVQQFSEKEGLLYHASDTEQFPLSTVYGGILHQNTILLSTNFGLLAYDIKDNKYDFYTQKATGLRTLEFNTNAFLLHQNQMAIFGSLKGVVLVNMNKIQAMANKYKTVPQLWKITALDSTISTINKTFSLTGKRFVKIEGQETIDFEDTDRDYLLVAPNYTFLQENVIQIARPKDTIFLHANRMLNPISIFGSFEEAGRKEVFSFSVDKNSFMQSLETIIKLRQNRDKDFWQRWVIAALGMLSILAFSIARWIWYLSNKNKQANKKYQLRRQLFTQLGNRLSSAKAYEDIHAAFQTITKNEMQETMEATKISMYKYDSTANLLRIIGHSDADPLDTEDNTDFEQIHGISFDLAVEADNHFPAVYFWKNKNKYKHTSEEKPTYYLLANNAKKDFYQQNGLKRPNAKRGKRTESFIFLLIGEIAHPFGILTIQNEKKEAFLEAKKLEEYLDLMTMIGQLAEFKVREIDETAQKTKERLKAVFYQSHSNFFRDRMETHFIGDILEVPKYYINESTGTSTLIKRSVRKFTGKAKKLFKELHSTDSLIATKKSVQLSRQYIEILEPILQITRNDKYQIVFKEQLQEVQEKKIPSFIAINLIHNSIINCVNNNIYEIEITFIAKQEGDKMLFSIEDNGLGFTPENFKIFEEWDKATNHKKDSLNTQEVRKNSTQVLMNFLKELALFYGEDIQLVHKNINNATGAITGANVTITIPLSCIEKYSQIKL